MIYKGGKIAAVALLALAVPIVSAPPARAQTGSTVDFPDVPANHWAYQSVQDLADKGIVKGYPDGKFLGDRTMTRYEFATIIDRMLQTIDDMKNGQTPTNLVTQDDLNKIQVLVDEFQPQLDDIKSNVAQAQSDIQDLRQNIADLRQDVEDAKDLADKAQATANNSYGTGIGNSRKFAISGYVQARYSDSTSSNTKDFPKGQPFNSGAYNGTYGLNSSNAGFDLRRARLKFTGQVSQNTRYDVQIDTSGQTGSTTTGSTNSSGVTTYTTKTNYPVSVREGFVAYTFADGNANANPTLTAGAFATPFGYELQTSTADILTPERPLAFGEESSGVGLFSGQDDDIGAKLDVPSGRAKYTVALVSGAGYASGAYNGTDGHEDQVYRASYKFGHMLSAGASFYNGEIAFTTATPSSPYADRKKQLGGADVQLSLTPNININSEFIDGIYGQRTYFESSSSNPSGLALTTAAAPGNRIEGYYVQGGYTVSPMGRHPLELAGSYDVLERASGGAGSGSNYNDIDWGYGAIYWLDKQTRLRLWYTDPLEVAHAATISPPPNVALFTTELEVKF